jgi:hypothetical protein
VQKERAGRERAGESTRGSDPGQGDGEARRHPENAQGVEGQGRYEALAEVGDSAHVREAAERGRYFGASGRIAGDEHSPGPGETRHRQRGQRRCHSADDEEDDVGPQAYRAEGDWFWPEMLSEANLGKVRALDGIAKRRGQTLAQMAIAWVLRNPGVTTALIGASLVAQLEDSLRALDHLDFDAAELAEIDRYATESGINFWAASSDL